MIYYDFWNIFHSPIDFVHSLAGGGALLTKDYHYQIRHLSPKAILATARLCSWYLMFTIWGLGLSLSWGWQGEDTGTGSMVQRVGVLHTGQHWTVMHIILGVSPVSVGPCMCAVRTQVTEDRPLKKCNCTTSTAQDQPSAGQGNIELSLERGRGAIFFSVPLTRQVVSLFEFCDLNEDQFAGTARTCVRVHVQYMYMYMYTYTHTAHSRELYSCRNSVLYAPVSWGHGVRGKRVTKKGERHRLSSATASPTSNAQNQKV